MEMVPAIIVCIILGLCFFSRLWFFKYMFVALFAALMGFE